MKMNEKDRKRQIEQKRQEKEVKVQQTMEKKHCSIIERKEMTDQKRQERQRSVSRIMREQAIHRE